MSLDDARYRALGKILQLEGLLAGRRYRPTLLELAQQLHVTPRTVVRYLRALQRVGRPVPPVRPHGDGSGGAAMEEAR